MKLSLKINLAILSVSALMIAVLVLLVVENSKQNLELEISHRLEDNAFQTMSKLNRVIFERISDIELLSSRNNAAMNSGSSETVFNYLKDIEKSRKAYASISLYDLNGIKIHDTRGLKIGLDESNKTFFREAIKGSVYNDPKPVMSESLGIPVIHFSGPLRNTDGAVIGVVAARFPITKINDIIEEQEYFKANNYEIDLVDSSGLLIFSNTNQRDVLKDDTSNDKILERLKSSNKNIITFIGKDKRNKEELKGHDEFFVAIEQGRFLDYHGNQWVLIIGVDAATILKPIDILVRKSLIIGFSLLLLTIPLSLLFSALVTGQIKSISEAASNISKGNFDISLKIKTKDELGDLSGAFNTMSGELKTYKAKLEGYSTDLEKKIREKTDELNEKIKELEVNKSAIMNILDDSDEANRQLVEAQESLKKNIMELKKLDQQKDQFISIAAHELKTPLTSIMGFSDLLKKDTIANNPEQRTKYLLTIFKDAKRLAELITNILDLSRMDIGTLKMALEQVSVYDLVKDTKEQMNIIIKNKGLDSEWKIEENLPSITIDKNKIIQVISNLINNAVHYTEKGKITIQAKKENNSVLFSVLDTGAGIPKESQQKIFTRFYQVDSPLTRKIGGTGLGLSLSKGFVEAMDGKIWFESEEGKGTTFFFTIPIFGAHEAKEVDIMQEIKKQGFAPVDDATKKRIVEEYLAAKETDTKSNAENQAIDKKIDIEYLEKKGYIFKLPGLEGKNLPAADIKSKEIIENAIKNLKEVLGTGAYKRLESPSLKIMPDGKVEILGNEIEVMESLVYMSEKFLGPATTESLKKEIKRISSAPQYTQRQDQETGANKEKTEDKSEKEEKANRFFGI